MKKQENLMNRAAARQSIISAFSAQSEISAIHLFGREADGKADEYSDFDLVLESTDLAKTQANYKDVLSRISPVIATLPIVREEKHMAEMICLQDLSPYQNWLEGIPLCDAIDRPFRPHIERGHPLVNA